MAKNDASGKKPGRIAQIRSVYKLTKQGDPKIGWILLGCFLGTAALFVVIGQVTGSLLLWLPLGLMFGLLVTMFVFGRRAERSAFTQMEGQAGAAAQVLKSIKRGWTVTEVVAATPSRHLSEAAVVHRAVGRPGILLIGEGNPNRVGHLIGAEKRKMVRMFSEVPVYDIVIGNAEGQVPLRKVRSYAMKLPRNLTKDGVRTVNNRMRALPNIQQQMPKGALPKNVRMPKGGPKIR